MVDVSSPPTTASWQKSSASGDPSTDCVQVTFTQGHVWVRDSKDSPGPILGVTREAWAAFLVGVRQSLLGSW
jgi:Domain of unknown function (DUF397)